MTTPNAAPRDAASRPLWRIYVAFLGPMIVSNILQALSGTVNNVYLGQMLGVQAMAAVSAVFPLVFFLIALMIGLGAGASVLIGQAWGAKDVDRVRAITGTTLMVGVYAGLVVALLGGTLAQPLLVALDTPADILADATAYARISLLGGPAIFTFLLVTSMQRGVGDTKTPLKTLLISTALGLTLTPALILGWAGPMPRAWLLWWRWHGRAGTWSAPATPWPPTPPCARTCGWMVQFCARCCASACPQVCP